MSGGLTQKVKTSLSGSHSMPKVLTLEVSSLITRLCNWSSSGRLLITTGSLDVHFLNLKLHLAKSLDSSRRRCRASSTVSHESNTSSTYVESLTVSAAFG